MAFGEQENQLERFIINKIKLDGPLNVGEFMALALGHPEMGYYVDNDPIGERGDFTTAPEISQLFGEMIGAWVADTWVKMGSPKQFSLVECGPGRGTMMADMLRLMVHVPGFKEAANIHLIDINTALRKSQEELLRTYTVQWHEKLDDVPVGMPIIAIGNEFLDVLPFRQFEKTTTGWSEKVVDFRNDRLTFDFWPASEEDVDKIPKGLQDCETGEVYESSYTRGGFVYQVCDRIQKDGGAALFVDYGHLKSGLGDTLQAIKEHKYIGILDDIGGSDITSHVDFASVRGVMGKMAAGPVTQGAFLKALGIEKRASLLKASGTDEQAEAVEAGLRRLIDADQMGELFKVIGCCGDENVKLAGF